LPSRSRSAKFEVTFAEWAACVAGRGCAANQNPEDEGWGRGRRPVILASWDDAIEYVTWLAKRTGKPYRLLTEAEWEYAARGVSKASTPHTVYSTGATISTDQANYNGIAYGMKGVDRRQSVEVGSFPGNAFGLHDMHGNASEWVQDCYGTYHDAPTDGSAVASADCSKRVLRGGSLMETALSLRSANRDGADPIVRLRDWGFRIARTL
jgi:formylglycine-generating enzyme required for sulfatase activity